MKWMLVVLVFGATPMETGLLYNSLDECLNAEAAMRADWDRVYKAMPRKYQDHPMPQSEVAKQMTKATCIPHGPLSHPN